MPGLDRLLQAQQIVEILAALYVGQGQGQGHASHQRDDLILARWIEGHRGCQYVARGASFIAFRRSSRRSFLRPA